MREPGRILTDRAAAIRARDALASRGLTLALTNGVFDLLHVGHARYLARAAALADRLWVGLNGDASVRALKGAGRPLVPWAERAELLAALRAVDAVLLFDEPTAEPLLRALRPDRYVKGGDYDPERLPEYDAAREIGAEVHFIPLVEGRSSSGLVERVLARYAGGR